MKNIENYYRKELLKNGFQEELSSTPYGIDGQLYSIPSYIGKGIYWVYSQEDLYDIKIHDFYFYEDSSFDFEIQKNNLSICYYDSVSGEEISPYHPLYAGCVKSFIGGNKPCQTIIHKNIPVRAIEIEITPAYYEKYLKQAFPHDYDSLYKSFCDITLTSHFPELVQLFHQINDYHGSGMAAKLFYDAKVAEAISLIIEHNIKQKNETTLLISHQDMALLDDVTAYIRDHFHMNISMDHLCHIACMGRTKLKTLFKQRYHCTITEFIQQCRLNHAESLLKTTDLTIQQIAIAVGYSNSGRFAALFQQRTKLLPSEYRKIAQNKL